MDCNCEDPEVISKLAKCQTEVIRTLPASGCSGGAPTGEDKKYWYHGAYRCWENDNNRAHAILRGLHRKLWGMLMTEIQLWTIWNRNKIVG